MKYGDRLKKVIPLFLVLLAGLPIAAGLSDTIALADPPSSPKDFSFLPKRSVSADFDGDHRPDIACGRYKGQTYQVEIDFSSGKSPVSIAFPATYPGFNIFAQDIDGDNDQDLVIVSTSSSFPSAVWLNKDEGHFEQGSRWWWATLLTGHDSPDFHSSTSRIDPAFLSPDHRSLLQPSTAPHGTTLEVCASLPQRLHSKFTTILSTAFSTRAPPPDSLQLKSHN